MLWSPDSAAIASLCLLVLGRVGSVDFAFRGFSRCAALAQVFMHWESGMPFSLDSRVLSGVQFAGYLNECVSLFNSGECCLQEVNRVRRWNGNRFDGDLLR
ncbi:hypothetical protein Taro_038874 [Colocasia esculenta]|uniref:Uncharacterized protein n=1 Tax=Colocasia esculenta TaxID=4460 RepID=A0A843WF27_COLES|nr:hypothetical protein [Colocasia esculenta]